MIPFVCSLYYYYWIVANTIVVNNDRRAIEDIVHAKLIGYQFHKREQKKTMKFWVGSLWRMLDAIVIVRHNNGGLWRPRRILLWAAHPSPPTPPYRSPTGFSIVLRQSAAVFY